MFRSPIRSLRRSGRLAGLASAITLTLGALLAAPSATPAFADGQLYGQHHGSFGKAYSSRGSGPELVLYGDRAFRGPSAVVDRAVDLRGSGLNDRVSSIAVLGGRWEVCADPNFRGRCEIIDFDVAELARLGLNDRITSIRPVGHRYGGGQRDRVRGHRDERDLFGGPGGWKGDRHDGGFTGHRGRDVRNAPVILFTDPDGRGRAVPIYGPEPHLNPLRINDVVSSIDVRSGAWLVCSDPNYRGRCEVVSGFEPRTRVLGLNDNISSIRPVEGRRGRRGHR